MTGLEDRLNRAQARFGALQRKREEAEGIRLECEAEMLRLQGEIRVLEDLMEEAGIRRVDELPTTSAPVVRLDSPRPGR